MKPNFRVARSLATAIPAIILSACSSDAPNTPTDTTGIVFEPCADIADLDCGEFDAPLIHESTDNRRIRINVVRLPGVGDGPHEPLLLNIGGPGSGTDVIREFAQSEGIPVEIRERFDIIGLDHRGVGDSLFVDCDDLGDTAPVPYPENQDDLLTLVTESTMLADACFAEHGDRLQWVGSSAVAHDIDLLRSLLNAPTLNIIGSSFGTRVTALYLERFPATSGRIVLDAPLPPSAHISDMLMDMAAAQQISFESMLNACGREVTNCDRSTIESVILARVDSILEAGDHNTFKAFFQLLSIAVEESDAGLLLAPLLIDYAITGDPNEMFTLIRDLGLDAEGADEEGADSITLERAVLCADDASRPDSDSLLASLTTLNDTTNLFAETVLPMAASCSGWPEALQPLSSIETSDTPTSLIIGGTSDVRTPFNWAEETADALNGVLVSSDHQGHTTLFTRENTCVDSIVFEFLLAGTLPPTGTSCP